MKRCWAAKSILKIGRKIGKFLRPSIFPPTVFFSASRYFCTSSRPLCNSNPRFPPFTFVSKIVNLSLFLNEFFAISFERLRHLSSEKFMEASSFFLMDSKRIVKMNPSRFFRDFHFSWFPTNSKKKFSSWFFNELQEFSDLPPGICKNAPDGRRVECRSEGGENGSRRAAGAERGAQGLECHCHWKWVLWSFFNKTKRPYFELKVLTYFNSIAIESKGASYNSK